MSLISIVITLIVVGLILWLEETYVPLTEGWKKLIRIVVVVIVALWLLQLFGILDTFQSITIKPLKLK